MGHAVVTSVKKKSRKDIMTSLEDGVCLLMLSQEINSAVLISLVDSESTSISNQQSSPLFASIAASEVRGQRSWRRSFSGFLMADAMECDGQLMAL